jgi:hypothetical protein
VGVEVVCPTETVAVVAGDATGDDRAVAGSGTRAAVGAGVALLELARSVATSKVYGAGSEQIRPSGAPGPMWTPEATTDRE